MSTVTRREWLAALAAASAPAAQNQTPTTRATPPEAYPGVAYRDYSRCLPDHLRDLAAAAYRRRNRAITAALARPEALRARQRWVRDTFWKLTGGMPERTPLETRVTGSFERDGYRVEKLVYQSSPRFHIPANLYIPAAGHPPYPGVLFQMGHALNGKASASYQRCCQALAKLGYLVLAFDPMGQGERIYYADASGIHTRLGSADDEHTVPGRQMLLLGDTATRLQVWDAVRSLDVLAAHPLVDPKRLASTGQSGGATVTMLLAAVDDRLAAAAVSSGNTENFACADYNPPGSTDDAEQNFVGAGPLGFDRWDLLYPLAPKPLLIASSDKDFYGTYSPSYVTSGWEEFQKLKRAYALLGAADKLAWGGTPLPHGLGYDMRLQIYSWFERWLKGEATPVRVEPPTMPESDQTLRVSESGSVVRSFSSETPFTLNRARPSGRAAARLQDLLVVDAPAVAARLAVLGLTPAAFGEIEAVEVRSATRVWTPLWIFAPRQLDALRPAILLLEPGGRNASWQEGGLAQTLAASGFLVASADVRGVGDLQPEFGRGSPRYTRPHQQEEHYAWASMMLGQPLAGQRAVDILAVVTALQRRAIRVVVAARGHMTLPATFAAALSRKIDALYLVGGLKSFRALVDTENYDHTFGNFVPGILRHMDLPEIEGSIAPRRVLKGAEWSAEAIRSALAQA